MGRGSRWLARFGEALLVLVVAATFGVAIWHEAIRDDEETDSSGAARAGGSAVGGAVIPSESAIPEMAPRVRREPPIVIDAGHGGVDGGTVGHGLIEKNPALAIARRVRDELEKRGHRVLMTRDEDVTLSLEKRSALANREGGKLLVSVHLNAGPASVSGIETFYSDPKSLSTATALRRAFPVLPGTELRDQRHILLAERVQAALCAATGARDRGIKNRPELSVTRHTECPAVLVECGFVSHAGEAARLATPAYQQKLARGIADGIETYLQDAAEDPWFGILRTHPEEKPEAVDVVTDSVAER